MVRLVAHAFVLTTLFAIPAAAGDAMPLDAPKKSPRAKRMFLEAKQLWESAKPVAAQARMGKTPVAGADAKLAVNNIEKAVLLWERGLRLQWDIDANKSLADATRAYFRLLKLVPKPVAPEDPDEKKKFEKSRKSQLRDQVRDARRRLIAYGKSRKYEVQFHRCDRCSGRKDLHSALGGSQPCPKCARRGVLVDKKQVIRAKWLIHSPLYREDSNNRAKINGSLQRAIFRPSSVGPFVKSFTVAGTSEKSTHWIRFSAKQALIDSPDTKHAPKTEASYVLFRVGKIWYLYSPRHDRDLFELPEPVDSDAATANK